MKNPEYSFLLQWDERDEQYVATCPAFPSLAAFGDSPQEALSEAEMILAMFLEEYEADGVALPSPDTLNTYSGQTRLRLPKSLHRSLAEQAQREGVSLNTLLVALLAGGLVERQVQANRARQQHRGAKPARVS